MEICAPSRQECVREGQEEWKRFRRQHVAAGVRVCLLDRLIYEVFCTDMWEGKQLSWQSEVEVCV